MSVYLKDINQEDCNLVYKWANDEEVRKNSFNSGKINYENHVKWFEKKLMSDNSLMYICYNDNVPAGIIRLDIEEDCAVIGFSVDKDFRGKGYGTTMLLLLENKLKESNMPITKLVGQVKHSNLSSQKVFEKVNYFKSDNGDYIKYTKFIG